MPKDYVDRMLEQWRTERPDLDPSPLSAVSRVLRLATHLKTADSRVLAEHDVAPWMFEVMAALRRQGPPYALSPTDLRKAALLTSGAMTNRIDRLEQLGWVERFDDPEDRRSVRVHLTREGRRVVDRLLEVRLVNADRLLEPLTASERRELAMLLKKLLLPLSSRTPGVPLHTTGSGS